MLSNTIFKRIRKMFKSFEIQFFDILPSFLIYSIMSMLLFLIPLFFIYRKIPTISDLIDTLGRVGSSTFLISFCTLTTGIISYLISKQAKYNDVITSSRLEWMKEVRKLLSKYTELTVDQSNLLQKSNPSDDIKNKIYRNSPRIKSLTNQLIIHFNMEDILDNEIINLIKEITNYVSLKNERKDEDKFKEMHETLVVKVNAYLKDVWEVVKIEAR